MFKPTSPENLIIIANLEAKLTAVSMGGMVTYPDLNKIAGGDVQSSYRHLLSSARERVEKNLGCCFETVRDLGVRRLSSSATPEVGLTAIRRCRSAAKRGRKRLDRVNPNSLAPPEQRRVIGYSAMLGAVAMIADGRKAVAIAAVADPMKPIPPENILDMFRV